MAVTKYLDKTGLTYFWNKIKAWCNSLFALDANVVHKTGVETVIGLKTFSGELPHATTSVVHGLEIRDPSTDREQTYNVNHISQILFCDVNGNYYGDSNNHHRLGLIQVNKSSIDTRAMEIGVYKLIDNAIEYSNLSVGITNTNIKFAVAPSTPNRNNDTDIITRDWIPQDTRIVHTTGDETIGGEKTFSSNATIAKSSPMLILNDTGTNSDTHSNLVFNDASTTVACIRLYKSSDFQIGRASSIGGSWFNGGLITFLDDGSLHLRTMDSTGTLTCRLALASAGTLTYNGPKPAASDDSMKLATTEWVRDATGNFACNASTATKLATARTINGVSFDGSANITVTDSTKVAKVGDTMTGNLIISKASPRLETKNTAITRGTSP